MDPPPPPKPEQKSEKPKPDGSDTPNDIPRGSPAIRYIRSSPQLGEESEAIHPRTAVKCSKCTPANVKPPAPPPPCPPTCRNLDSQWHISSHTCGKSSSSNGRPTPQKSEPQPRVVPHTCIPPAPSTDRPVPLPPAAPCACGSRATTPHSCCDTDASKSQLPAEPADRRVSHHKCVAGSTVELPIVKKSSDAKLADKNEPPKEKKVVPRHKCQLDGPPRSRLPVKKEKNRECDYCRDNRDSWLSNSNVQQIAVAVLLLGTLIAVGVIVAKKRA